MFTKRTHFEQTTLPQSMRVDVLPNEPIFPHAPPFRTDASPRPSRASKARSISLPNAFLTKETSFLSNTRIHPGAPPAQELPNRFNGFLWVSSAAAIENYQTNPFVAAPENCKLKTSKLPSYPGLTLPVALGNLSPGLINN